METKTIGSFIAVLRKAYGLTQKQLAEKLCVSDKTVSRWEREETTPDLSLIPVIAEIFGVTSDELLRGERKPQTAEQLVPETESAEPKMQKVWKITSSMQVRGQKQMERILTAARTKYTTRIIISVVIAFVGWVIAIGLALASAEYAAITAALVAHLIGIAYQIISAISVFASINSGDFTGPQVSALKRRIVNSAMLSASGIAVLATILLTGLILHDVVESLILGSFWAAAAVIVCWGICHLITQTLLANGHCYLDYLDK